MSIPKDDDGRADNDISDCDRYILSVRGKATKIRTRRAKKEEEVQQNQERRRHKKRNRNG